MAYEVGSLTQSVFDRFNAMMFSSELRPNLLQKEAWYNIKLIKSKMAGARPPTEPISYQSHLESVTAIFDANNVKSKAKTHLGRRAGAQMAELDNVPEMQIRRAGRWNLSTMESRYLNHLPRNFMRSRAGFNESGGEFFLDRALVDPPASLRDKVFPWVLEFQERNLPCLASGGFLHLVMYLRTVLLQDMAMLKKDMPDHFIFGHAPFDSSEFETFASEVWVRQESAEDPATIRLRHLVPDISQQLSNLHSAFNQQAEANKAQAETNKAIPKAIDSLAKFVDAKISASTSQMDRMQENFEAFARHILDTRPRQEGKTLPIVVIARSSAN